MEKKLTSLLISILLLMTFNSKGLPQSEEPEMVLGKFQTFSSTVLGEKVSYLVDLPGNYNNSDVRYPVIFTLNSQMVTTYGNALATVNQLGGDLIPEMILVGICNTGEAGKYFPVNTRGEVGEADTLLKFLEQEFLPFIDENYRTTHYRILFGQSNTGLFTLYTLLTKPELFKSYIAASPSLGWCLNFMKERALTRFQSPPGLRNFLYMNYGGRDLPELVIEPTRDFIQFLEKYDPSGLKWKVEILEKDGHVPIASLNNGLLALFPHYFVSDELKGKGLVAVDEHFSRLSDDYGFQVVAPEPVLFDMGYELRKQKYFEEAIRFLTVLLQRYPSSARSYFLLGEIFREKGDIQSARESYQQALAINPNFQPAWRRLQLLDTEKQPD